MDQQKLQSNKIFLSILAFLILLAGTTTILYYSTSNKGQTAFFARSINDASYDCEAKIVSKYGSELASKSFDNISSRYETNKRQYIIYYRISVKESDEGFTVVNDYMAKCIVWERLGYVSEFRVYKF
jgi:hypothetical protein